MEIKNLSTISKGVRFKIAAVRQKLTYYQACRDLERAGNPTTLPALQSAFAKADRYTQWNHWSLDHKSIIWIAELIVSQSITNIVEFGAGYSTVVLADFLTQVSPGTCLDSFEHQKTYSDRLMAHLPPKARIRLHCCELLQVDDQVFGELFSSSQPYADFVASGAPIPAQRQHETRLRNTFYRYNFRQFAPQSIDLIILDGPNGNGRSLAFPFLKHAVKLPAWLLIDDYLDYPFLHDLQRVFDHRIERHLEIQGKEFALVKLAGKR